MDQNSPGTVSPMHALRQTMVDNYANMELQIDRLKMQVNQLQGTNEGLVRENYLIKESLDTRTRELQMLQGYAVRLATRLENLQDHIRHITSFGQGAVSKIDDILQEARTNTAATQAGSAEEPVDASDQAKAEDTTPAKPDPTGDTLAAIEQALLDSRDGHVTEVPPVGL